MHVLVVLVAVLRGRGAVRRLVRALTALEGVSTMLGGAFLACASFFPATELWPVVGWASGAALVFLGIVHLWAWVLWGRVS